VNVPSAAGDLVFAVVGSEYEGLSNFSGDTEHWNISRPQGSTTTNGAGGTVASASSSVTVSWDLGAADHWAIGGVSIKPATAGSTATFAKAENVKYTNLATGGTNHIRLRFLVSNEGTAAENVAYELQPPTMPSMTVQRLSGKYIPLITSASAARILPTIYSMPTPTMRCPIRPGPALLAVV
jgi:hypothetical protein